jgi:phosphatidate cytidylyltransferase
MADAKGSDLLTRVASGLVMIAVAVACLLAGGWFFRLLAAVAAAAMLFEWAGIDKAPWLWRIAGAVLVALALLVLSQWQFAVGETYMADGEEVIVAEALRPVWLCFGILAALGGIAALLSRRLAMLTGFLYIGLPAFALILLEWARTDLVFWVLFVTWATDILAYFAGRSIGGPKLAPRISPNKTWAGLIGGVLGAAIAGAVAATWFDLGTPFVYMGAPMAVLAQLGDLYESSVKRRAGVKDSGAIIPGHGGVLDRLDGLLPVSLATLLLLIATAGSV